MQINLSIKGQSLALNPSEVGDLLKAIEYGMQGNRASKTFGSVTAAGFTDAGQRRQGVHQFNEQGYILTDI